MDVLNTYGGGVDRVFVFLAILVGIIAILLLIAAVVTIEIDAFIVGLIAAAFAVVFALNAHEPVRHEVTLRPGYVIDATKYEIVEQRGEIYVIEEREGARE